MRVMSKECQDSQKSLHGSQPEVVKNPPGKIKDD